MHTEPIITIELGESKFPITFYGVFLALGILACIAVLYLYTKKKKVPSAVQDYVFFVAIFAIGVGFIFAKLFQAIYNYIATGIFNFGSAGITVMGGLVGGALSFLALYFSVGKLVFRGAKKNLHVKYFNEVFLIAPICICIAHAFGRIGCLMGGCCHGAYLGKDYVFGGVFMHVNGVVVDGITVTSGYFVPTQLYEALFLFVLFGILSILYFKKFNVTMHVYLIAYAIWRMIIEFLRTDYRGELAPGLAPSQWMSIIFFILGVALFVIYYIFKIPFKLKDDDK